MSVIDCRTGALQEYPAFVESIRFVCLFNIELLHFAAFVLLLVGDIHPSI